MRNGTRIMEVERAGGGEEDEEKRPTLTVPSTVDNRMIMHSYNCMGQRASGILLLAILSIYAKVGLGFAR